MQPIPSELGTETALSPLSTGVGDHPGTARCCMRLLFLFFFLVFVFFFFFSLFSLAAWHFVNRKTEVCSAAADFPIAADFCGDALSEPAEQL
jgi:hypothetical protein